MYKIERDIFGEDGTLVYLDFGDSYLTICLLKLTMYNEKGKITIKSL